MIPKKYLIAFVSLVFGIYCLWGASPALADTAFHVSLNTSQLSVLHPGSSFALDFQLNDGSGTLDGNNTATLTNFSFGGGSASGSPDLFGGASGSLSASVALIDSSFLNEFMQGFTPGTILSFDVGLTTNLDAGPIPDKFIFAITEPVVLSFFDVFVELDIDSANPIVQVSSVEGNGVILTPVVQSVPEPMTLSLLLWGLAGITPASLLHQSRRGRRREPECRHPLIYTKY
jgi:hypothetical protein